MSQNTALDTTGQAVWEALLADVEFAVQPKKVLNAMEPFMRHLPELLADMQDSPVTVASLFEAKVRFLEYAVANDYVGKTIKAQPKNGFFDADELLEMFGGMIQSMLDTLKNILPQIPDFLEQQGVDEDAFMRHPKGGRLTGEALALYNKNMLTIGKLLVTCPIAIVKISD